MKTNSLTINGEDFQIKEVLYDSAVSAPSAEHVMVSVTSKPKGRKNTRKKPFNAGATSVTAKDDHRFFSPY